MNEHDLRDAFRRLADQDSRTAPVFSPARIDAMRPALRAQRRRRWVTASSFAFVAAVIVTVVVIPRTTGLDLDIPDMDLATSTDFLLVTPGSSLLRTIPTIGSVTPPQSASQHIPERDSSRRNK